MPTEAIAPPISAAQPSAPPAAPPAAPPSAPAPEAPVATVPSAPAPELSTLERIDQAFKKAGAEIEAEENAPEVPQAAPPAAEPPKVEEPKTAPEAPPAEALPAQPPPDLPELDDGTTIAPSQLAKTINDSPELKAFFDKPESQGVKNQLFAMARRLEKGGAVLRMIPSEAEAKELIETSGRFQEFDDGMNAVSTPEQAWEYWNKLHSDFALKNDKGESVANPAFVHIQRAVFDAGTNFLLNHSKEQGVIHPKLEPMFNQMLEVLSSKAAKENNPDLKLAVDALREAYPASSQPQGVQLTPAQKEREAEISRREQEANRRDLDTRQSTVKGLFDGAEVTAIQSAVDQATPRLEKAGLNKAERDIAFERIGKRLAEELKANGLYDQRLKRLKANLERNPTQENSQKITEHMIEYQNIGLGKIISDVLNEITEGKVGRQSQVEEKRAQQIDLSRSEPRGAIAAPAAPQTLTPAQEHTESQKLWERDNHGERMPLEFHLSRMSKRIQQEVGS